MENAISCKICCNKYNETDNIPYLLPSCAHTICKNCLSKIESTTMKCPFCNQFFNNLRKNIKPNYEILDILRDINNLNYLTCGLCNNNIDIPQVYDNRGIVNLVCSKCSERPEFLNCSKSLNDYVNQIEVKVKDDKYKMNEITFDNFRLRTIENYFEKLKENIINQIDKQKSKLLGDLNSEINQKLNILFVSEVTNNEKIINQKEFILESIKTQKSNLSNKTNIPGLIQKFKELEISTLCLRNDFIQESDIIENFNEEFRTIISKSESYLSEKIDHSINLKQIINDLPLKTSILLEKKEVQPPKFTNKLRQTQFINQNANQINEKVEQNEYVVSIIGIRNTHKMEKVKLILKGFGDCDPSIIHLPDSDYYGIKLIFQTFTSLQEYMKKKRYEFTTDGVTVELKQNPKKEGNRFYASYKL